MRYVDRILWKAFSQQGRKLLVEGFNLFRWKRRSHFRGRPYPAAPRLVGVRHVQRENDGRLWTDARLTCAIDVSLKCQRPIGFIGMADQ